MTIVPILPRLAASDQKTQDPVGLLTESTCEVTRLLRDLVRCDAFCLTAWNPLAETHRHVTLVSDGYSDALLAHVEDEFVRSSEAFAIAHRGDSRALRWRDLRRDWNLRFTETPTAQTYLVPAGYKEGSTMCLRLPDGRYTGTISMSWSTAAGATDERREIIERFRGILSGVCDCLRVPRLMAESIVPNAFALVVSSSGKAGCLPDRSPGPNLGEGGALGQLVCRAMASRLPPRFLWADENGMCHRVVITPCTGDVSLVVEHPLPWPYGLSLREIQVLDLVACGASNPEIAQILFISPRTASTHIEHVLAKTGCASRARLAALAVSEGILLPDVPWRRRGMEAGKR